MFTEATRVQLPALVHLTRLGFSYIGKIAKGNSDVNYDAETNILVDEFKTSFCRLNAGKENEFDQIFQLLRQELDYDDLGKAFYKHLVGCSPRLVDFDNPDNNTYHCTGEFTCANGLDEFRPDITLFINGLPIVYIEVKKPNNKEGIVAERNREYLRRFPSKKFRRFNNITQFMIFSNNMEYDSMGGIVPVQGAFYCTNAHRSSPFNCFREENIKNDKIPAFYQNFQYGDIDRDVERIILSDFNCQVLLNAPEYKTNLDHLTPTNRILTSMCSRERLLYILKYAFAYLKNEKEEDGKIVTTDEKHIMRYQQFFASLAIRQKISDGIKSGIIWHTQGSGKTALAYYLSNILTDYYASKNIVPKFYFIVDRLDLLEQATIEFESRGLKVVTANSRSELMEQFRQNSSQQGNTGSHEITVVNIQKFETDTHRVDLQYATNLQRIFIIDEAHRGYKPNGCFLSNLFSADKNAIKIALTGTPLIGEERKSCEVFGKYLHTYYYDRSIQDGYTLKIIREEIETSWKNKLQEVYKKLDVLVQKKELQKHQIIEHESFVRPLFEYVSNDLKVFRKIHGDDTLGGMIICETSEQARKLYECFEKARNNVEVCTQRITTTLPDGTVRIYENTITKPKGEPALRAGLILYDSDDKDTRKQAIKDFKKNMTIDVLIVFNMLLTGFDAPRLKRLYFGRKIKDHNLLQAITRVNRPYKDNRYGYLIDFADIQQNFNETNEAYLRELNAFNDPNQVGEENVTDTFTQVLENQDEILRKMNEINSVLFLYPTNNLEEFSNNISELDNKKELIELRHVLETAKDVGNLVATFGNDDLKENFKLVDAQNIPQMLREVNRRIDIINLKERFNPSEEAQLAIEETMAEIQFKFNKIGQNELKMISGGIELQNKYANVIHAFVENYDQEDPELISLKKLFLERFKDHNFVIDTIAKFNEEVAEMDKVLDKLRSIKRSNDNLRLKYNGDIKFVRIHKRIREENIARQRRIPIHKPIINYREPSFYNVLWGIKQSVDRAVYDRSDILKQDAFFSQTVMQLVSKGLMSLNVSPERPDKLFIQQKITAQYQEQYNETYSLRA